MRLDILVKKQLKDYLLSETSDMEKTYVWNPNNSSRNIRIKINTASNITPTKSFHL